MGKAEVAEVKATSTAVALTGRFEEDAQSGFIGMNQEDFALPFLRLLTTRRQRLVHWTAQCRV